MLTGLHVAHYSNCKKCGGFTQHLAIYRNKTEHLEELDHRVCLNCHPDKEEIERILSYLMKILGKDNNSTTSDQKSN